MAKTRRTGAVLRAQHGVVASLPNDFFGYFAWPSIAQTAGERLVVAASGLRNDAHCPFGRTVLCDSEDGGQSWSSPRVINDTPLDDREAGLVALGEERLLLTWLSREDQKRAGKQLLSINDRETADRWRAGFARMGPYEVDEFAGAWMRLSEDGGRQWEAPQRLMLAAPHGPIALQTGGLLLLGKYFSSMDSYASGAGAIASMRSTDGGRSWDLGGTVPLMEDTVEAQYSDAHCVELPDGRLLGLLSFRDTSADDESAGYSMLQTRSENRGRQWSVPEPLSLHGGPPHLLRHSLGTLICTYGYRKPPYGQRVMMSVDEGETWDCDYVLRDDGVDAELGFPASVELKDGSVLTVYYQKERNVRDRCSLQWTRWSLPG